MCNCQKSQIGNITNDLFMYKKNKSVHASKQHRVLNLSPNNQPFTSREKENFQNQNRTSHQQSHMPIHSPDSNVRLIKPAREKQSKTQGSKHSESQRLQKEYRRKELFNQNIINIEKQNEGHMCVNHRFKSARYCIADQGQNDELIYFCDACALMVATKGFQIREAIPDFCKTPPQVDRITPNAKRQLNSERTQSERKFRKIQSEVQQVWKQLDQKHQYIDSSIINVELQLKRYIAQLNLYFNSLYREMEKLKCGFIRKIQVKVKDLSGLRSEIGEMFRNLIRRTEQIGQSLTIAPHLNKLEAWSSQLNEIRKATQEVAAENISFLPLKLRKVSKVVHHIKELILLPDEADLSERRCNTMAGPDSTFSHNQLSQLLLADSQQSQQFEPNANSEGYQESVTQEQSQQANMMADSDAFTLNNYYILHLKTDSSISNVSSNTDFLLNFDESSILLEQNK